MINQYYLRRSVFNRLHKVDDIKTQSVCERIGLKAQDLTRVSISNQLRFCAIKHFTSHYFSCLSFVRLVYQL